MARIALDLNSILVDLKRILMALAARNIQYLSIHIIIPFFRQMENLSIFMPKICSAIAVINLCGNQVSYFCQLSRSKPYVTGVNLMTLIHDPGDFL